MGLAFSTRLRQLLDLALRGVELLETETVELLAALPERDRVVQRDVAALEPLDDLRQLLLGFLELHGRTSAPVPARPVPPLFGGSVEPTPRTSPTVPEKPPSARRTSISSPEASVEAARTTAPSWRTMA